MSEPQQRPHHAFSPSTLGSLEVCPCYQGKQSDTPHERTVAGTKAHGVAESGEDDNELSDDDATLAIECMAFAAERKRLMELSGPVLELKEGYLPIDDIDTTAGYFDHALISESQKYSEIMDWKYGRWHVTPAKDNPQAWAYVLGIFKAYPAIDTIKFFFKMPLIESLSEATFTRDQIPAMYLRLQVIVARARAARESKDFSVANPIAPTCSFCANLAKCPAVAALALKIGARFYPLSVPENITPSALHDTRDITLGLRLAQVVTVWAAAFKNHITNKVLCREADVPAGFVLQSKSIREVADVEKYKTVALAYVTPEQFSESCNVVFGKIEKVIKDAAPRGQKTAAIEAFNLELESAGAVVKGEPFTFLKAVSEKSE